MAESDAASANAGPGALDGLEETGNINPAIPSGGAAASIAGEQPATAAEPTPATLPTEPADAPPLELAPPDWPPLTLQMLFYSPDSARSFVQINGRNYRVGERLDDGPEVLEIAADGVILAHQGAVVRLAMDR